MLGNYIATLLIPIIKGGMTILNIRRSSSTLGHIFSTRSKPFQVQLLNSTWGQSF